MSKLNVDNIENRLGTGGPQLPGATFTDNIVGTAASFTGIVTATSLSVTDITATGNVCLLYTSPSPRDISGSRMPSSA